MLQPIKATAPTEATESTGSVSPISEQRPGQTLRDRLYKLPEIGAKKSPATTGNQQNLYQQYSLAKMLPATPLAAVQAMPATATLATKFGAYKSPDGTTPATSFGKFMSYLGSMHKAPAEMGYFHFGNISGLYDKSLEEYIGKYGRTKDISFIQSLKRADDLQRLRQNPNYQPIMMKADVYESEYDRAFKAAGGTSDLSQKYSLTKEEIASIRKTAEDTGVGDKGFWELLDKGAAAKFMEQSAPKAAKAIEIANKPFESNWNDAREIFGINDSITLQRLTQGEYSQDPEKAGKWQKLSENIGKAMEAYGAYSDVYSTYEWAEWGASAPTGAFPYLRAASMLAGVYAGWSKQKQAELMDKDIGLFRADGTLRSLYSDFNTRERGILDEIAKSAEMSKDDVAKMLSSTAVVDLQNRLAKYGDYYDKASASLSTDKYITAGDGGLSLKNTI